VTPRHEIDAAARQRPGWDIQQVEQDIVLTRLMAEVANDKYLAEALVLKGGTCLHKLWLPEPWRYSKDLDYARTEDTPMGATFDALRAAGQRVGMNGTRTRVSSGRLVSHVTYRATYADGATMKITVDIPTSPPAVPAQTRTRTLTVAHPGGTTTAEIVSVTPEEMIASKAAAVFVRRQPRDAYDVWAATAAGLTTAQQAAARFQHYRTSGWSLGRAVSNLDAKWADAHYLAELRAFGAQAPTPFGLAACRAAVDEMIVQCSLQSHHVTGTASSGTADRPRRQRTRDHDTIPTGPTTKRPQIEDALRKGNRTHAEIAKALGVSRSWVSEVARQVQQQRSSLPSTGHSGA